MLDCRGSHEAENRPPVRSRLAFVKHLEARAPLVWRLITDTRTWPLWGPSVRAVDCRERFIQAGSAGRIRTPFGIWLPFAVEAFEPEYYWDWRVAGVAATGHRVTPVGPNQCTLTFSVPIWAIGYGFVCQLALNRIGRLLS